MSDPTIPGVRRPVAYKNESFLDSPDARELRILSEYLQPLAQLAAQGVTDTIVFFGSARIAEDGPLARYYQDARTLAREVTTWAHQVDPSGSRFVVCSGGGGGIMEAANRGASEAGGRTLGLNIGLPHEQRPNPFLMPELTFEFHYFFMRKLWFAHLARAVVVFPAGFGTLDELFEIVTLRQTGKLPRILIELLERPRLADACRTEEHHSVVNVRLFQRAQRGQVLGEYAHWTPGIAVDELRIQVCERRLPFNGSVWLHGFHDCYLTLQQG